MKVRELAKTCSSCNNGARPCWYCRNVRHVPGTKGRCTCRPAKCTCQYREVEVKAFLGIFYWR